VRADDKVRYIYGRDALGNPVVAAAFQAVKDADGDEFIVVGASYSCESAPNKALGRKIAEGRLKTRDRGQAVGRAITAALPPTLTMAQISELALDAALRHNYAPRWARRQVVRKGT
jgi:hypothetical protein